MGEQLFDGSQGKKKSIWLVCQINETIGPIEGPRPFILCVYDMDGQTHAEFSEALEDSRGNAVAVGPHPPWPGENVPNPISGYIPDVDGVARPAAYEANLPPRFVFLPSAGVY